MGYVLVSVFVVGKGVCVDFLEEGCVAGVAVLF